ncbi:malate synthase [Reinekea marinisedimentorum]|uniref:Malate synthase n=1 Tax=Reinekea marinisedimentorum TaxID=230495 RepID=A0A4R3IBH3_9GAMM|nr:malate synthase [Reinekea marinisedimentorum]TCS43970.1 malate synthase [Reinekea marinisedimentorum]
MTALTAQPFESGFDNFIEEEATLIHSLNTARIRQMMAYSKRFLDEAIPLKRGSHKDVKSYIVYYQHLLAFFDDGSQSGLQDPQQFVAFSGSKEKPESLVFKNDQGFHVELIINPRGKRGCIDHAHIDDIQVETTGAEMQRVSIAANDATGHHHWFSMVRGDSHITMNTEGKPEIHCIHKAKDFRAKDGSDYHID